jgi:uncharacterized membrane protein SpoIIM required for sporulation
MRTQDDFVAARRHQWNELETLLGQDRELHRLAPPSISRAASLYRILCADLMWARGAGYGADVVGHLNALAARAHNALYGARPWRLPRAARLLVHEFPRTLRRRWRFLATAWAVFLFPLAVGAWGAIESSTFAQRVLPAEHLAAMAEMYAEGFSGGRAEGTDATMAGYYVHNNIGIAFRCFATGILFGLGSLFFLFYNGLLIGTTTGHVIVSGGGANILAFMCGHGVFELTAIVISGAAGLQMGYALVETGGRTRLGSLRAQAGELAHLVLGAAAMLFVAALVEGFWSPSSLPPLVKWIAAGIFALLVLAWLSLGGRGTASAREEEP